MFRLKRPVFCSDPAVPMILAKTLKSALLVYRGAFGKIPKPEKWVFIVGCYNSGTTLLHKILASHPDIGSMPFEGQVCTNQFITPKDLGIPRLWAVKSDQFHLVEDGAPQSVAKKIKRQWGRNFDDIDSPILVEKSITNGARIRWLNQFFENSYFIAIVRNGYCVAEGIHRKTGHSYELCARQWAKSNEIMLSDLAKVPRALRISYEEFTNAPRDVVGRIFDFIGVNHRFDETGVVEDQFAIHGVRSKIRDMNPDSLSRLKLADVEDIESEALQMLVKFGYYLGDGETD